MSDKDTVEMRGDVSAWAAAVFEGVRRGRGMTKDALLAQILLEWAKKEVHVATLVERMTRGNAPDDRTEGNSRGD